MNDNTREERRSALDDFAAAAPKQELVEAAVFAGPTVRPAQGAQAVAVRRDEGAILVKLKALAAAAGSDWYYRYPVRNKKTGETKWIEGPSIKLANDLARMYGNDEVDLRVFDQGNSWMMYARFYDIENGFSLTRPFQQRKSAGRIGGDDDERRLEMALAIGASKASRNVIVNALQTFADFALEEAKSALVEKIGKDLENWRGRTIERITSMVPLDRVEAVMGRAAKDWLAPDIARVIAMGKAVQDGMATVDETFPVKAAEAAPGGSEAALDAFAAKQVEDDPGAAHAPVDGDGGGGDLPPSQDTAAADRLDAVNRLLALANDPENHTTEGRLEALDLARPAYEHLPDSFTKPLFDTVTKVVLGELKTEAARKYLEALK